MPAAPDWIPPVSILLALLLLAYVAMWRGWRRRAGKHHLPTLVSTPAVDELPEARLEAAARYFGTTVSGDWLDRVVAQGLGMRSTSRIRLSSEGIDVVRVGASFRIPAGTLRGARHERGIAGKVVPPNGILVVTWKHGDYLLDTGFRLEPSREDQKAGRTRVTDAHNEWMRSISKMARDNKEQHA